MTTEEIEKLVESNQEVIAKLNARNEALEQEVAEIKAHSKSIEGMKPWEIETRKLNATNINSPYGRKCMCEAMNSYLAENNASNTSASYYNALPKTK